MRWMVALTLAAMGCGAEKPEEGGGTDASHWPPPTTRPAPTSTSEGCRTRVDTGSRGETGDTGYTTYPTTNTDTGGGGCG